MQKHFAAIMALLALPCLSVQADPTAKPSEREDAAILRIASIRGANPRTGMSCSRRQRFGFKKQRASKPMPCPLSTSCCVGRLRPPPEAETQVEWRTRGARHSKLLGFWFGLASSQDLMNSRRSGLRTSA